jgi:hypothetical protein
LGEAVAEAIEGGGCDGGDAIDRLLEGLFGFGDELVGVGAGGTADGGGGWGVDFDEEGAAFVLEFCEVFGLVGHGEDECLWFVLLYTVVESCFLWVLEGWRFYLGFTEGWGSVKFG